MKVILASDEHLIIKQISNTTNLNFLIQDYFGRDIINLKGDNNQYYIYSNSKYKILPKPEDRSQFIDKDIITFNTKYYLLDIESNKILELYILEDSNIKYVKYSIESLERNILFCGKYYVDSDITYLLEEFTYSKIEFELHEKNYKLILKDVPFNIYVGNNIYNNSNLQYGECLFINGVFITIMKNFLVMYYYNDAIALKNNNLKMILDSDIEYNNYFIKGDFSKIKSLTNFRRVPKIQRKIETKIFKIDGPGAQELKDEMPVILTMLPMMLMSMTSMITVINVVNSITMGEKTVEESLGSLIVAGCMILAMILYPIISNAYKKRRESKREIKRISEYKDYIYEKKRMILSEIDFQKKEICDNYYNTLESKEIIENITNKLWERKKETDNFLTISLGTGRIQPDIKIEIPEEHFTIDRDKLRVQLEKLQEETEFIKDVPIVFDFRKYNVLSFIGTIDYLHNYITSFLIRTFACCSYEDLKMVILTDYYNKDYWYKYIDMPYLWNDEKNLRFFGYDTDSYNSIINYIDEKYRERLSSKDNDNDDNKIFSNYLIFVENVSKIKNISVLNEILKNKIDLGFTIIFISTKMDLLPSDCKNFIYLSKSEGKLVSNENMNYFEKKFNPDILYDDFDLCFKNLSNINLDFFEKKFILPTKYDFLEMYDVGTIDNLDINSRWNNNSIIDSLAVPIGIDDNGDIINLNLHENAHGPHGLVAGMTGSGKSELLITYILSLAINYSPEEVQFVLIDYKGGGLANTFYNSNIGMNLPHVVGVITNLNENEISRSLISLKSEIKRRQRLFSIASIKFNEGNMDIYKYETLYSLHGDIERLSHLFIISDEFAELKTQNPEFISELISIARIGRSLGVHLILSTQKPSGVVDDQIWSNSRFKICLKVQDKNDSNDMIKVPNAAMLKEAGRFYLQIGFNELFVKGQSAYSGVTYYPRDITEKNKDNKIDFINENGKKYYSIDSNEEKNLESKGKVVTNIVKYIIELSKKMNINIKGLWRELIPDKIFYDDLIEKYDFGKTDTIKSAIGEYDAPELQRKGLATIDLLGKGNLVIYGIIDSGKEMLLQSMIYSLISTYSTKDINIYIMDFGSESLINFKNAPQVGDVMFIDNKEKIFNSFKYFDAIIDERKKILTEYNGDLLVYNQKSNNKLPVIILIINVLETLFENYDELTDDFTRFIRDSNRYGISIVVTTNGINNVRNKILQGFKQSITLELKDKYDYTNIFGSRVLNKPAKCKGRGFIDMENIYEFQTALISNDNSIEIIDDKCKEMQKIYEKARPIPVLPSIINYNIIKPYLIDNTILPIGVNVEDLGVEKFNFISKRGVIITALDMELLMNFYNSLEKNIVSFSNNKLYIFNSYKKYVNLNHITNVINSDYTVYLNQLKDFVLKSNINTTSYICFIGIYDIYNSFDITYKKEFNNILKLLNQNDKFSIVFIDSSTNMKKLEFEEFYRNNINNNRGIWVGNGLSEQMVLKYGRIPREFRDTITNKFGFTVENGIVNKVKLLDYFGDEDNEK